jgi:dTDP-4-amino-4,6-dideoxygalactose transaminase
MATLPSSGSGHEPLLPVMRPRLPGADALLPYLRQIDASRIYGNYGPLATDLDARLASHYGTGDYTVTTVANATLALALALTAQNPRPGTLCVMPAWTFVASAQAAVLAGLVPFFVDVDEGTWALDPAGTMDLVARSPREVGAIMTVLPFGQPIDTAAWDRVRVKTGVAVVIDAAAGFDTLTPGAAPAVVSLHATKALGAGEGAFVVSEDPSLILAIRTRANFGFYGSREALVPAFNAKMSEHHCAVAHAALDEWREARAEWLAVARQYRARLDRSGLQLQTGLGDQWVSSVCVVDVGQGAMATAEDALRAAGIETRRWWSDGAHAHRATLDLPRMPLPVTERLARSTLGVPCFRDLDPSHIARVADVLTACRAPYHAAV